MTDTIVERRRAAPGNGVLPWLGSLAVGLLLGGASLVGDAVGIRVLNGLANAAGPWLLAAFVAGLVHRGVRAGALAGAVSLVVAVATYYLGLRVIWGPDHAYAGPLIALWFVAALVGGSVFGGAGAVWVSSAGTARAIAGALPIAALFAEAAHRLIQIDPFTGFDPSGTYAQVMVAEAIAGGVLARLLIRGDGDGRRTGYLAAAGLSVAGLAAFLAVETLARTLAFL